MRRVGHLKISPPFSFDKPGGIVDHYVQTVQSKNRAIDLYNADNSETLTIVVASSHCLWFNVKIKVSLSMGALLSPFTFNGSPQLKIVSLPLSRNFPKTMFRLTNWTKAFPDE